MFFNKKIEYFERLSDKDAFSLVKLAEKGDDRAFSKLVELYEKDVYNLAMYILGNREDALDVSQETFVYFWRSLKNFRGECGVKSYILRITKNASYDLLRKKQVRQTVSLTTYDGENESEIDIPDTSDEADPVKSYTRNENIALVRRGISLLDEEQKEIIVMRDINGMPYAEIAEALGVAEGTVKSRLSRARSNLKRILLELGYE